MPRCLEQIKGEIKKAAKSDLAEPAVVADKIAAVGLGDSEEVRKRLEQRFRALKAQAIAAFDRIARKTVVKGQDKGISSTACLGALWKRRPT